MLDTYGSDATPQGILPRGGYGDIVVDAEHRGNGFGRQAMILAEGYARSQGAETLGLNVFGFNTAARGLYESLGYETTSIKMRKTL